MQLKRLHLLSLAIALTFQSSCESEGAGVEAPTCAIECPAGTRFASFTEASVEGQQAIVDGQAFLVGSVTASCERLCVPIQTCSYPNVPEIFSDPETGDLAYRCDPLEGYTLLDPDIEVDTSFGDLWQGSTGAPVDSEDLSICCFSGQVAATGDIDGDGAIDFAMGTTDTKSDGAQVETFDRINVHLGTGARDPVAGPDGAFRLEASSRPTHIAAGDLDGDGDVELVASVRGTEGKDWLHYVRVAEIDPADVPADAPYQCRPEGAGSPSGPYRCLWTPRQIWKIAGQLRQLDLADFDGDGRPDLLWLETNHPSAYPEVGAKGLALRLHDGEMDPFGGLGEDLGALVAIEQSAVGASTVAYDLRDAEGDGDLDLVTLAADGSLRLHLNGGAADFVTSLVPGNYNGAGYPVLGDFDGDGAGDIVVISSSETLWLPGAATGPSAAVTIDPEAFGGWIVGDSPFALDFDQDGYDDLVFRGNRGDGTAFEERLVIWFGHPDSGLGEQAFRGARNATFTRNAVADLDADGYPDLIGEWEGDIRVIFGGAR